MSNSAPASTVSGASKLASPVGPPVGSTLASGLAETLALGLASVETAAGARAP